MQATYDPVSMGFRHVMLFIKQPVAQASISNSPFTLRVRANGAQSDRLGRQAEISGVNCRSRVEIRSLRWSFLFLRRCSWSWSCAVLPDSWEITSSRSRCSMFNSLSRCLMPSASAVIIMAGFSTSTVKHRFSIDPKKTKNETVAGSRTCSPGRNLRKIPLTFCFFRVSFHQPPPPLERAASCAAAPG